MQRFCAGFVVLFSGVLAVSSVNAQRPEAGVMAQLYPAGVILTGSLTLPLSDRVDLTGFAGANLTDRDDFGEHAHEEGGGGGVGLRWRWYPRVGRTGVHLGARADLWFMTIDWQDPGSRTGSSRITVLQPTAVAGWTWRLGPRVRLDAAAALGAEVNVRTDGEEVGEGAILLGGVGLIWRF